MSTHKLFTDRVVLVTGGGSGIGRATCFRFHEEGAAVVVVNRTRHKAEKVAKEIQDRGGDAFAIACDVSSADEIVSSVQQTIEHYGRIDVLVNNAAICPQKPLLETSISEWNQVISTNLTPVFLYAKEVIPHMLAQGGGQIVNVSSVHALATLDGYAPYAASKGGIQALTRSLAIEFAKKNIRVNAVLPGAVHTNMLESSVKHLDTPKEEIMKTWDQSQPIGRVGKPEEIAEAVLFAANPNNSFMTGAALVSDGGMTIEL